MAGEALAVIIRFAGQVGPSAQTLNPHKRQFSSFTPQKGPALLLPPDSWLKHSFPKPLGFIAAALAALAAYLAVEHGCIQAQEAKGDANYTPLALAVPAYAIAAIAVALNAHYPRLVRILAVVTFPVAVFLVPALAVGVVKDIGARACAVQR